jgi:short-subunit dehydrogenase|tara:strand:- start:42 stop:767 length:726 start_codon:yes stop_codon:yes gene_type:complete
LVQPTALLIGGSSGIGKAFCDSLLASQYKVIVASRSSDKLQQLCTDMKALHPTNSHLSVHVCDCTSKDACNELYQYIVKRKDNINLIVHTAGDFKWDTDTSSTTSSSVHDYLMMSNMTTKTNFFDVFQPLLVNNATMKTIVVGSQAGSPTFKQDMEQREGKGAVDNELGYIRAMQSVRNWTLALQTKVPSKVVLLEPSLVKTEMAKREFSILSGIDWSKVPSPKEYVQSVISNVMETDGED